VNAIQLAIADACLGERADRTVTLDLPAFLARHGVAPDDVAAVAGAPKRLAVYRSLVRNGLSGVVLRMLPRTRARMNAAASGRFDKDFAKFVDAVGPRTHYLRDVPEELVAWAEPHWRRDPGVPAYLPELATFELAHFAVGASDAAVRGEVVEVALDRPIALSGSARLLRFEWAVHELPEAEDATEPPVQRDVRLLAYRDEDHAVRWLELTPLAALVVERLGAGERLGEAVAASCAEMGTVPQAVLPDVASLLADLGERGVILGGR
jgi:hypothetical protein